MAKIVLAALDRYPLRRAGLGEVLVERGSERGMEIEDVLAPVATFVELLLHRHGEAGLDVLERDAVLRTLGSRERRLNLRQFKLEHVGEDGVRRRLGAVHALSLAVSGEQGEMRGRPAGIRR